MIQDTSREAYDALQPVLNERQTEVFDVIREFGALCNSDIAELLDVPISYVTPRVGELRKKGLVVESHRAIYLPTNRKVIHWKAA
ncbi:helix-turn-helix DNA binding domain protein [Mycobacterium phage Yecey3]|uniref:Helix-turn-helix DNA binding domain protein n=1 Tax=Mycobacterium phage Yecey3 TaxID=2656617 RepID=A0A649V9J4_9CAUD|nr:helix-turn-helix DNA-binding domain protein [Mycobacterium phage Yecey3]QGJ88819.1 helix-turn-helix DNA binding domain protein [Mycobacterium phage Yecey3]